MKTIKLLLCVFLTAMSFNVFADENGRYQMQQKTPTEYDIGWGAFVLDTKTGDIKYCSFTGTGGQGLLCHHGKQYKFLGDQ